MVSICIKNALNQQLLTESVEAQGVRVRCVCMMMMVVVGGNNGKKRSDNEEAPIQEEEEQEAPGRNAHEATINN